MDEFLRIVAFSLWLAFPRNLVPDGLVAAITLLWLLAAFRILLRRMRGQFFSMHSDSEMMLDNERWILLKQYGRLAFAVGLLVITYRTSKFLEPVFRYNPVEKADFKDVLTVVPAYFHRMWPTILDLVFGFAGFTVVDIGMSNIKPPKDQRPLMSTAESSEVVTGR